MIDRTNLSTKIQKELTRYCDSSKSRRDRNRANGDCINENEKKTHGKATHGCRCRACYAVHKKVPIEDVPVAYRRPEYLDRMAKLDAYLASMATDQRAQP